MAVVGIVMAAHQTRYYVAFFACGAACGPKPMIDASPQASVPSLASAAPVAQVSLSAAPVPNEAAPVPNEAASCRAPSLTPSQDRDARSAAALGDCRFAKTGHDDIGDRCGTPGFEHAVSLARLNEALPVFDEATVANIRAIAQRGRSLSRKARAFALIGDSITASPKFMLLPTDMSDDVRAALRLPNGTSTVAWYQQGKAFSAPRLAKIGAQSRWALQNGAARIDEIVRTVSPAVAIVMFGSNDATVRFVDHGTLVEGYTARLSRIIERLLQHGVVPILNTIPRHNHDPARLACDGKPGDLSNWRLAVQTNALSEAVAKLACSEHLPLIDLRHALDATLNHGIGPDGVHPNAHKSGAGALTAEGLQCGYNVRNYVTMRMLRQIHPYL
jgi:lysophospholipase L1-like esterase